MNHPKTAHRAAAALAVAVLAMPNMATAAEDVRTLQWHLGALNIGRAQAISQGDGIIVGVMDTGSDGSHPDLTGNVLAGLDLIDPGGNGWKDTDGHGTGMAGLIVAHGHGPAALQGALGLAPQAKVLPVRVMDGGGPDEWVTGKQKVASPQAQAQALGWLVDHNAKIVNMAYTVPTDDVMQQAIQAAHARGVIVVTAAGNSDKAGFTDNGAINASIVAGASDRAGNVDPITVQPGPFSPITMLAPGRDIASTSKQGGYRIGTGTSPSSALLSATAALVWSHMPDLNADGVVWRINRTAHDVRKAGFDRQTGWGTVDVVAALTAKVEANPAARKGAITSCGPGLLPSACLPPRQLPPPAVTNTSSGKPWAVAAALAISIITIAGLIVFRMRRQRSPAARQPR